MKKIFALLCAALLLCAPAMAEEAGQQEQYREMPYYLRVTQRTEEGKLGRYQEILKTYPDTVNDTIDAQMRALVDDMAERSIPLLPEGEKDEIASLDVGAVISRTGTSWMSFLTLAQITYEREVTHMEADVRVYDIETGERITLADIFPQDSEAWDMLAAAVHDQLTAAFPGIEPDQTALDALCAKEALQEAAFTLGGAKLTLTYRADSVYPGRSNTLLHVTLYYPDIRQHMTERAFVQTDNSRFVMVALTYDDGGGGKYTRRLLGEMRNHGVTATFFLVGRQLRRNHDNLVRQQNSGYSLQYHSYTHPYGHKVHYDQAFEEKAMFEAELSAITGVVPTLMRAPGGKEEKYMRWEIGYPLIHWSLASTDSGNPHVDAIASRVIRYAWDGDIVLLHDINDQVNKYSKKIFENFNSCGMMTVTVEELFAHAGIALEKNKTYYSTKPDQEEE